MISQSPAALCRCSPCIGVPHQCCHGYGCVLAAAAVCCSVGANSLKLTAGGGRGGGRSGVMGSEWKEWVKRSAERTEHTANRV